MAVTRARLFGLTIESDLPLPGLLPCGPDAKVDLRERREDFAGDADLSFPGVADFRVEEGRRVAIRAARDVPERNIRLYLLGSAMGLVLHQRGLFPLHANAVELRGRAIAVAGPSGAGKSTLAAWFHRQRLRLIGDDVCVLRPCEGAVLAYPGVPRLRLWGNALEATGQDRSGLERAYAGDDEWDKWDVPVQEAEVVRDGLALAAVYILADGDLLKIERLSGVEAASALFDHTYRGDLIEKVGLAATHWKTVLTLLERVPVYRLERPFDLTRLDDLGRKLLAHAQSI